LLILSQIIIIIILVVFAYFRALHKQENTKYKKLKKNKKKIKKILVRKIYQNAQEIIKNWLTKIKIYKIEKFDSEFLTNEDPISQHVCV
jgi:hypothetical protein